MFGVDSSVVNNTLRVGNMPVAGIPGEDARMNQDKSTIDKEVRRDVYHAQVGITEPDHVFEEGPPHLDRDVCYAQTDVEFDHSQVFHPPFRQVVNTSMNFLRGVFQYSGSTKVLQCPVPCGTVLW